MIIVPDTNILVSAEISDQGSVNQLLRSLIAAHYIVLSEAILNELARVLSARFGYSNEAVSEVVTRLMAVSEIVEPATFDTQICRDPDDDAILGTATAGHADCIVTGDNDLLVLGRFRGVDIIAPSDFARYEVESSGR